MLHSYISCKNERVFQLNDSKNIKDTFSAGVPKNIKMTRNVCFPQNFCNFLQEDYCTDHSHGHLPPTNLIKRGLG